MVVNSNTASTVTLLSTVNKKACSTSQPNDAKVTLAVCITSEAHRDGETIASHGEIQYDNMIRLAIFSRAQSRRLASLIFGTEPKKTRKSNEEKLKTNKCSAVAEMGDRLVTIDMDRKLGVCVPLGEGLAPNLTMSPGPRPTSLPSGILIHLLCPFRGGGAGSPSNTMWTGPRPTSMSSFILIHPAVWPQ